MATTKAPPFTVVIDTREQLPLTFHGIATVIGTLPTGDYSIAGFEHRIAVERKSRADAWMCVASERDRFERCLERLGKLERGAIVIECSQRELAERPEYIQRITPATVIGSYISWSVKHNVQLYWCDSRSWAERTILRYFAGYLKHVVGVPLLDHRETSTQCEASAPLLDGPTSLSADVHSDPAAG